MNNAKHVQSACEVALCMYYIHAMGLPLAQTCTYT